MALNQSILLFALLSASVGVWWLALRIVFGRRFVGPLEWIPVALAAYCIPIVLAGSAAVSPGGWSEGQLLGAWFGIAVVIDLGWGLSRIYAWVGRTLKKSRR